MMQGKTQTVHKFLSIETLDGTLARRVHCVLKDAILTLEYKPGEILSKPEICLALGVSRSPVSEAIAKLADEGLVDVIPQAGTFVSRFSMAEILEGLFLREALEMAAVEHVAQHITNDQVQQLHTNMAHQKAQVSLGDFASFHLLDREMHDLIMSFTGFKHLVSLAETSWLQVNRARRLDLPSQGRLQSSYQEHTDIVSAIVNRDPVAAQKATRYHLRQLIKHIKPLELARPDLFLTPGK